MFRLMTAIIRLTNTVQLRRRMYQDLYIFPNSNTPPHITILPHFPPTQALLHRTAPPTTQASNQDRPAPPERVEHPT